MSDNLTKSWKELMTMIFNWAFMLCGLVYLACIPLGLIDSEQKLQLSELGLITLLLVANSRLIQRVSQLKIGKDGLELSVSKIQQEIQKEIDKRSSYDSELLKSIDLHLSETMPLQVNYQTFKEQIDKGSSMIAEYIYFRAKEARHQAWRSQKKGIIERTIPIFRALIDSKKGDKKHRFYAQLGYGLKDREAPQWSEARDMLEQAIQLWRRENDQEDLPPYYCFNWLICLTEIAKLNNYRDIYAPSLQSKIYQRLRAIANCTQLMTFLQKSETFQQWQKHYGQNAEWEEEVLWLKGNGNCHREHYAEAN